jgi:hypothetical protein
MSKYGKYFLQHILWLKDEFCDYYVQDHTWCPQDILDVPCIIFDFREDAQQWLHQCVKNDRITAIRRLRRFLAYECLEYIQVHRLNDQQVIQAAARQLTLRVHKIVIKPGFGWAVQLNHSAEPVLPVTVEPEPQVDSLLAELKGHLDGLVAEQQKKYDQYEARLAAMSLEQRAAAYSQKAGSGIYDGTLGGIVDLVKAAPGIFSGYLKILAQAAALPAQAARLTARAMAEGDIGVLTQEIDRIATSISQNIDQALEYKAMLQIVFSDEQTMEILYDFAERYYKATHPLERTQMGASALSDVVVTIILALLTAGVGAAANILSKSARLAKAARLLRKIATVLKRTGSHHRLPKKHLDAGPGSGTLAKATQAKKSGIPEIQIT